MTFQLLGFVAFLPVLELRVPDAAGGDSPSGQRSGAVEKVIRAVCRGGAKSADTPIASLKRYCKAGSPDARYDVKSPACDGLDPA